ncbi:OmpA family protein [Novosphingobium sp.]|uniref:OmpA family protein n=1 Tax=Novosphingobium sp. TaxID=1874826 RepID=UPI003B51A9A9
MATSHADPAAPAKLAPRFGVGHTQFSLDFMSGSSDLSDADKQAADKFSVALANPALAGKHFLIGGHTSAIGSRASNLDLSQRRAQAVVDYLAAKGADRSLFTVKGFGFDQPLPGTSPSSATNRRVDVTKLD